MNPFICPTLFLSLPPSGFNQGAIWIPPPHIPPPTHTHTQKMESYTQRSLLYLRGETGGLTVNNLNKDFKKVIRDLGKPA